MKKFYIYELVLGTWFEGRKRLDGVVDLRMIRGYHASPVTINAPDSQTALHIAKMQGFKAPIIGEVPNIQFIH